MKYKIGDIVSFYHIEELNKKCPTCGHKEYFYKKTVRTGRIISIKLACLFSYESTSIIDKISTDKDGNKIHVPSLKKIVAPSKTKIYEIQFGGGTVEKIGKEIIKKI